MRMSELLHGHASMSLRSVLFMMGIHLYCKVHTFERTFAFAARDASVFVLCAIEKQLLTSKPIQFGTLLLEPQRS